MASLLELTELLEKGTPGASPLFDKIIAAVLVEAEVIRTESDAISNHANRLIWAKQAFVHPKTKAAEMFGCLLAASATASQTNIENATDTAIQSAVSDAVDVFSDGS